MQVRLTYRVPIFRCLIVAGLMLCAGGLNAQIKRDTLYIVDGQPSEVSSKDIDPNRVLYIETLKNEKAHVFNRDIIIVITKDHARKLYQKRFSKLSNNYKKQLEKNRSEDRYWTYVINGKVQIKNSDSTLRTLFELPEESIEKIKFTQTSNSVGHNPIAAVVSITTTNK